MRFLKFMFRKIFALWNEDPTDFMFGLAFIFIISDFVLLLTVAAGWLDGVWVMVTTAIVMLLLAIAVIVIFFTSGLPAIKKWLVALMAEYKKECSK